MPEPYIIAEIGSNLFKSADADTNLEMGKSQIAAAKDAGADAVKFQLFTAAEIFGPAAEGTKWGAEVDKYALPVSWLQPLKDHCDSAGIDFMCSAFSVAGYQAIEPMVSIHKIASPEVLHPDIGTYVAGTGKTFLWSDGCSTALTGQGVRMLCISKYPAMSEDYNLDEAPSSGDWGLSDHTKSTALAREARQRGARYFEKHVDFFKHEGSHTPDTPVSADDRIFRAWVNAIRNESNPLRGKACEKYGRQSKDGGWYRPVPEGSAD